jgi:hypothetical protein
MTMASFSPMRWRAGRKSGVQMLSKAPLSPKASTNCFTRNAAVADPSVVSQAGR